MVYTVKKIAQLSGVSIRTLHFYDEVGLLRPAYHGSNGYRYYEEKELLMLQQILFFKELGFELKKIQKILKKGDFDKLAALISHKEVLLKDLVRTRKLIRTIDQTMKHLKGQIKMKDKQFFDGLNSPKQKEYEKYLIESGRITKEDLDEGRKRIASWSKKDSEETKAEWEDLLKRYLGAIKKEVSPKSQEALNLVSLHLQYLRRFGIEMKREEVYEKGVFFLSHPDWRKEFDQVHPKLYEFMLSTMEAYSKQA